MTTTYEVGQRVKFVGMVQPATILSGPHRTHGAPRWLIRKADDTVSLVSGTYLSEWYDPRIPLVAQTLYATLSGSAARLRYEALPTDSKAVYTGTASAVLKALDAAGA